MSTELKPDDYSTSPSRCELAWGGPSLHGEAHTLTIADVAKLTKKLIFSNALLHYYMHCESAEGSFNTTFVRSEFGSKAQVIIQ